MFIYSNSMIAQMHIDTIYANEKKNVALFFPNPIRQAITGTSHFVFNYNREKEQYFGFREPNLSNKQIFKMEWGN